MNQAVIFKLVQGSEEWERHRLLYRNASEAAAVMELSPWMTRYMLWELKTSRRAVAQNYAMARGVELEPLARAAYEADTDHIMEPVVMVRGEYSASLDGMLLDNSLILEIKCPLKGQESDTWQLAKQGKVQDHYMAQIQHQLMVSGAEACDFFVFDGRSSGVCVRVQPDLELQIRIQRAWDEFWGYIVRDEPPALTSSDTVVRSDRAWADAAKAFMDAKERAEKTAKAAEDAKQRLAALASHNSERGYGVSVCRYWKGAKASKEEVRVTVLKQDEEQAC